ncbi:MAG TPA: hypothetical protein DCS42_13350 [Nitrospiraceae bacterium]|nr:hypothetical protein [Nitrospiraceae bacterium]
MIRIYSSRSLAPVLLLGLLFFCACKPSPDEEFDEEAPTVSADLIVVATMNGDPITLGEFQERFTRSGFKPDKEAEEEVKREFLNRLIERKMMLREAQRRRISVTLQEINKRIEEVRAEHGLELKGLLSSAGIDFEKLKSDIWENVMIEKLLDREVDRHATVSSGEIRQYYRDHADRFNKPEQVRARQIVVATEQEAQKALERLEKRADFAALAKDLSTAPEAARGGDLGYFALGDMPNEFNVVFRLPKGGTSGVVKSPYGYHIFKLEDRRLPGKFSLEEATPDIRAILFQEKREKLFSRWMKELRSRTKFEVNYQALQQ